MEEVKIKSIDKVLKILECFSIDEPELGVTEISRKLDMYKSNVYDIVDTLTKRGYLERNPKNKKYRLGLKILQLSYNLYYSYDMRKILRPFLEDISHKVDEAVYLGVFYNNEVMYVDTIFPSYSVLTRNIIGVKAPLYCTAIGKAILASLNDDMIENILNEPMEAYTQNTITDKNLLWDEIKRIRENGFAIDDMEHEYGIKCVGVSLKSLDDMHKYAVSISGPSLRFDDEKIKECVRLLSDLKRKMDKMLG